MNTLADPGTCTEWVVSEVGIEEKVLMGREVVRELGVSVWKGGKKKGRIYLSILHSVGGVRAAGET